MKKISLIIALSTTFGMHGMNFIRNLIFVHPERTVTKLRTFLQRKNPHICKDEARNLINGTYGIKQFQNTPYTTEKSIFLAENGNTLSISRKNIDTIVNQAKYASPYIPHWVTNTYFGIAGACSTATPILHGTTFVGTFATEAPTTIIDPYLATVGLVTLTGAAVGGGVYAYVSNSILKFFARKFDCKV